MRVGCFFILLLCVSGQVGGQELKCGYYPDGKLRYKGYFTDGKPLGEMVRYYPEGNVQAKMNYQGDGVDAVLFSRNGEYTMAGKYRQQKKEGVWEVRRGKQLVARDEYRENMLDGKSVRYAENESVVEEKHWKGGRLDGVWKLFFPDGGLKLQMCYVAGKLGGEMLSWFPDGTLRAKGQYRNNLKDGVWEFYDATGKLLRKQTYHRGIPENAEELELEESQQLDALIQKGNSIPDPAVFADDPEAYMKLTGIE